MTNFHFLAPCRFSCFFRKRKAHVFVNWWVSGGKKLLNSGSCIIRTCLFQNPAQFHQTPKRFLFPQCRKTSNQNEAGRLQKKGMHEFYQEMPQYSTKFNAFIHPQPCMCIKDRIHFPPHSHADSKACWLAEKYRSLNDNPGKVHCHNILLGFLCALNQCQPLVFSPDNSQSMTGSAKLGGSGGRRNV